VQKKLIPTLDDNTCLNSENIAYLEFLYQQYLANNDSVTLEWQQYFKQPVPMPPPTCIHGTIEHAYKQTQVSMLLNAYRCLGHLQAALDPLQLRPHTVVPELTLSHHHLSEQDLSTNFETDITGFALQRPLHDIIQTLESLYCGTVAMEFMHIPNAYERNWIQTQIESLLQAPPLSDTIKHRILTRLIAAEGHEKYLAAQYPGAKRFSLEGCDSLIVALDELIRYASASGIQEIVLGMTHRGRLNVLVNVLGKNPNQLFAEFEGASEAAERAGDVKYHQGFSSNIETPTGTVHLSLAFNPSHLEIVSPVVCGSARARQERRKDEFHTTVLPVVIHGDAAFSGQGVVMETLNMSKTHGYHVGGTVHIIVNNQIGFTTSNTEDARSTRYCSDIGKMIEIPIFHVNADDPEAVFKMVRLALEYRHTFKKDVIMNIVGYRRHGHNEADEPAVTQPILYQLIRKQPTVCQLYSQLLIESGIVDSSTVDTWVNEYRTLLDHRQAIRIHANPSVHDLVEQGRTSWQPYFTEDWRVPTKTAVPINILNPLLQKLQTLPEDFVLHARVQKIMNDRNNMAKQIIPIDWGYGEILAYATLLNEGYSIRIAGQDSARGTFFHRHAILYNQVNGETYTPLNHVSNEGALFSMVNSLLSEEAVLAFEYGYSTTDPNHLVIWEAQFGDFANGAQVVIDQFISSGEQKWGRLSGLTLFLPHGYEGQGPEHSSARLERFLQLCALHNIQIGVPSTPAQMFHMLRRQLLRPLRKPLIILTPKSLLRHKLATSTLTELSEGGFLPIISETDTLSVGQINRIVLCSGKLYYDLLEHRRTQQWNSVAIIRIEQLYPFPTLELQAALLPYLKVEDVVWCQEEPENQGAWYGIQRPLISCLSKQQKLRYIGRAPSASPAVGYAHLHQAEQAALLQEVFSFQDKPLKTIFKIENPERKSYGHHRN